MAMMMATTVPMYWMGAPNSSARHSIPAREGVGVQPAIVVQVLDQGRDGRRVRRFHQCGAKNLAPVVIGAEEVQVGEDLAVRNSLAGLHDPYYVPVRPPKVQFAPHLGAGEPAGNGRAHHHLAPSRIEPPALEQLQFLPHRNTQRREAAQGDVHPVRVVRPGQVHDGDQFE